MSVATFITMSCFKQSHRISLKTVHLSVKKLIKGERLRERERERQRERDRERDRERKRERGRER